MARPQSISDETILTAAREVFLEQGYKATSAQIASHAGVSEGTLFRRFGNKVRLFMASMGIDAEPFHMEHLKALHKEGDIGRAVATLARGLLGFFAQVIPRMNTLMHSGIDPGLLFDGASDAPPLKALKSLTHFFEYEQNHGRLRRSADPAIMARNFMGTLHYNAWFSAHFGRWAPIDRDHFIEQTVQNFLQGIRPDDVAP